MASLRRFMPPLFILVLLFAAPLPAWPAARLSGPPDPLHAMLRRMDVFLHSEELGGITRDPRFELNPAEFARLSVVCQLLGYLELNRSISDTRNHNVDIVERADFLVEHFDVVHNGSASDGMLAYALFGAWEATGDPRYFAKAQEIVAQVKRLDGFAVTLNWGLMSGMALARSYRLTGDVASLVKLDQIVASLEEYTLPDGSYPHICVRKPDIHYTGWMTMELIAIARELDDPVRMERALRSAPFLGGRVGPDGATEYSAPCASCPGSVATYWSLGGGCTYDYDTRGWVNELGYLALAFDRAGDARYAPVIHFLATHEDQGAFPDKWDWFPTPEDPIYVWGSEPRSVVRTSILFWTLATILSNRETPAASSHIRLTAAAVTEAPSLLSWDPAGATFRFALDSAGAVDLAIYDVRGRVIRRVVGGTESAGAHAVAWDRRDDRGATVAPGLYFAHLITGERRESVRLVLAR